MPMVPVMTSYNPIYTTGMGATNYGTYGGAGGGGISMAGWGQFGSSVLGAIGDFASARHTKNSLMMQAGVLLEEADLIREQGLFAAQYVREEGEALHGAQLASYAKAGVALEGTPLDVLAETARRVELDALMVKYRGQVEERRTLQQREMVVREATSISKSSKLNLFGKIIGAGAMLLL